ncbi:MAG: nucleic acid-binding protein [Treponema sp.]|nr:nucleic acid-binding protein [Treponema sp.]
MVTTEVFENLKNLQEILVQKYELEAKVESAPKQLNNQEEALAKTQKEFIEKKAAYDETTAAVSSLKEELQIAISQREEYEKGIADSTTHRDYETLEKKISEVKDKEDELRHDLQKKEKELDELKTRLAEDEELIKFQESELNTSKDSLNSEISGYTKKINELKTKENKIAPKLDQEILFKFERIIQRNTEGIVAVRNGVCMGCHMILPANFANEVHEGENIKFCPYCSRILFYEEVSDELAEDYSGIGTAGSLADDDDYDEEDDDMIEESTESLYDDDLDSEDVSDDENSDLDDEDEDVDESDSDDED